jgi:hypothetical protein
MDIKELGWDGMGWINLSRYRYIPVAGSCEHGNELRI